MIARKHRLLAILVILSLLVAIMPAMALTATADDYGTQREYIISLVRGTGLDNRMIGTTNDDRDALIKSFGFIDNWDYDPTSVVTDEIKSGLDAAVADAYYGLKGALEKTPMEPYFVNGLAQPIFYYGNNHYNDSSGDGVIRFVVYVESDLDTDGDGKPDLVKVVVQLPRAALNGSKFSTIYEARPYIEGTNGQTVAGSIQSNGNSYLNANPGLKWSDLYAAPAPRIPAGETTTAWMAANSNYRDWYYRYSYSGTGNGSATITPGTGSNETLYEDLNWYDYYLVRGFAVVESAGIGSAGSEGFANCGADIEVNGLKCVIEWLTGDRIAYSDKTNNIEIKADWSNGNVGMTGRSYAGTTQFGIATSGVPGLKTIVPVAGIASWYEYTNSQGVVGTAAYTVGLAWHVNSRVASPEWSAISNRYAGFSQLMRNEELALNGDYGPHWARRDYTVENWFRDWGPSKIQASMLIVHGSNDSNVRPKQSALMYEAAKKAGIEVKWLWHQGDHMTPSMPRANPNATDTFRPFSMYCEEYTYDEWLNLWFSHYLYDVDNHVTKRMPGVLALDNASANWVTYKSWDSETNLIFDERNRTLAGADSVILPYGFKYEEPVENEEVEFPIPDDLPIVANINDEPEGQNKAGLNDEVTESNETAKPGPTAEIAAAMSTVNETLINSANGSSSFQNFFDRPTAGSSVYSITLDEDVIVKGVTKINLRAAIRSVGTAATDNLRVHAKLVEVAAPGTTVRYFGSNTYGSAPGYTTVKSGGSWQGGGIASHNIVRFNQGGSGSYREIARGWLDLCNPGTDFDSYTSDRANRIVPSQNLDVYNNYTLCLQPAVHTAKAGNRLVLFITTGATNTAAYTGTSAFTFSIDNDATNAVVPVEYVCNHDSDVDEYVLIAPSCLDTGLMNVYCAGCDKLLNAKDKIPAQGHSFGPHHVIEGNIYKGTVYCIREGCGHSEEADLPAITNIKIDANVTVTVERGGVYNYNLFLNEGAYGFHIVWALSDPSLALVDNEGKVYILNKTGTVRLIATDPVSGNSHSITLRIAS